LSFAKPLTLPPLVPCWQLHPYQHGGHF
jgi:hypothetical protein